MSQHLSPDAALLLLTFGLMLIYLELNRPGLVLPGALGLFSTLLSVSVLVPLQRGPAAFLLVLSSAVLLLLELRRSTPLFLAVAATIGLCCGLELSVPAPQNSAVHLTIACVCGLTLGAGTSVLTRIAHRARINKGLD